MLLVRVENGYDIEYHRKHSRFGKYEGNGEES